MRKVKERRGSWTSRSAATSVPLHATSPLTVTMSTPSSPQPAGSSLPVRAVSPGDRDSILTAVQSRSAAAKIQPNQVSAWSLVLRRPAALTPTSQYDSERDARQAFRRGIAAINRNDPRRARASLDVRRDSPGRSSSFLLTLLRASSYSSCVTTS